MLNAIATLEEELSGLKERTGRKVNDVHSYLSRTNAKTKLRPRIKKNGEHSTFSIIWTRLIFYNHVNHRSIFKELRKGPGHRVPKSRLMAYCRSCDSYETEYIWEKELEFAQVRKKVAFLSLVLKLLKQYCAIEAQTEQESQVPKLEHNSIVTCIIPEHVIKTIERVLKDLENHTVQEISGVVARLAADGQTGVKPRIQFNKRTKAFSVEWVKENGSDPKTGLPVEREIPRERDYSIRRSRLLAHCKGSEDWEKDYLWEKELAFARVRRQVALLNQAIKALKQYCKETD